MQKLKYLNHIEVLRAIAVLLVVLYHLEIHLFKGGFIGVDVFFVISGFLITRLIKHEYETTGKFSFKNFYARRVRRLMPTLFLSIFATFVLAFFAFSPSDFIDVVNSMFMSSVALSNFYFLGQSGYFDTSSAFRPLLHTWSLGIEEQFYLLYPLSLILMLKFLKRRKTAIALVILFLLSLFLTVYTTKYGISDSITSLFLPEDDLNSGVASMHFYLLPFRMFEFFIGGIIAFAPEMKIRREGLKLSIDILGLAVIILSAILLDKNTNNLSILNVVPCLGAGVLLLFPRSSYTRGFFQNKILIHIGQISYTLYLVHWIVVVVYRYLTGGGFNIVERIILFILMFVLSSLIYKYYETPFRHTKARFSIKLNSNLAYLLIISILVTYVVKLKVNAADGWQWRLDKQSLELVEEIGDPIDYHWHNWGGTGYKAGWITPEAAANGSPDIILLGDSHASHYLYGMDSILFRENHKSIFACDWYSSLKLPEVIRNDGEDNIKKSLESYEECMRILDKYPKSTIIISQSWPSQIARSEVLDHSSAEYIRIPSDSIGYKVVADKILELHSLLGKDRKIIVFAATPTRNTNELNFIEKILRPKYVSGFFPTSSLFEQNNIELNHYLEKYLSESEHVHFIDPSEAFCTDGECITQHNNEIYYSDYYHLSKQGSLKAVKYLEDELLRIIND